MYNKSAPPETGEGVDLQPYSIVCYARIITPIFYTLRRKPSRLFFTLKPPKKKINTENKSNQGKKCNYHLIDPPTRIYCKLFQYLGHRRRIHTLPQPQQKITQNQDHRHHRAAEARQPYPCKVPESDQTP